MATKETRLLQLECSVFRFAQSSSKRFTYYQACRSRTSFIVYIRTCNFLFTRLLSWQSMRNHRGITISPHDSGHNSPEPTDSIHLVLYSYISHNIPNVYENLSMTSATFSLTPCLPSYFSSKLASASSALLPLISLKISASLGSPIQA